MNQSDSFKKVKRNIRMPDGYKKLSQWTSAQTVELGDGSTLESRCGSWDAAKDHADSAHARTDATKTESSANNGYLKINGTETKVYAHPNTSGYRHIPAGGEEGQILKCSGDGDAAWGNLSASNVFIGVCSTDEGTETKTVECPGFQLNDGVRVMVTFSNGSSTNYMALNVNGTGAYHAWFPLGQTCTDNDGAISRLIAAGCAYEFIFRENGEDSRWVYCGVVSTAESLGALANTGGAVSGNITGSGGGVFAVDGNIYLKSQGYDGWITNYLGQYFLSTGGVLAGDLIFQGRGRKLYFGNENSSCPYIFCNDGSDCDLQIHAPYGYVCINNDLAVVDSSYFNGNVNIENHQKNISLKLGSDVVIDFAGTGFRSSSASIGGGYPVFYGHGCIFGDNIDEGIMEYVARGHFYDHCFCSINENGKNLRIVTLSDGNVSCDTVNGKSADYAENWEWEDGNPKCEDRVGLFVTYKGSKTRISKKGDPLVKVGVISGSPCILGDADDGRAWKHKYLKDVYGRILRDEDGGLVINPDYDPNQVYISRSARPEWDAVGTHGKLVVRDDGTCQPDGFCVPTDGGIATAADDGFYVMERLDESHIRIYMR